MVLDYLDKLDKWLPNFLPGMLHGLAKSTRKDEVRKKLIHWIGARTYHPEVAWYLRSADDFEPALLVQTLEAALETRDNIAVITSLQVSIERYESQPDLIGSIFAPALAFLVRENDTRWINGIWYFPKREAVFRHLSKELADLVLVSMLSLPSIEYSSEDILADIAQAWPKEVMDFLVQRLDHAETRQESDRYEAIPFQLHGLSEPLSQLPEYIVGIARNLFAKEPRLFTYRGRRLLAIIFPGFSDELSRLLTALVLSGTSEDIKFVLALLRAYEGQTFLHEVCKEVVQALAPDDALLNEVEVILDATGVVSGEFGFVTAYQRKQMEIEPWLSDTREKVQAFAQRHLRSLERQLAAEQRRGEESLELRKRAYGGDTENSPHRVFD